VGDADPGDQLVTAFPHAPRDAGEVALFSKRLIRIHESLLAAMDILTRCGSEMQPTRLALVSGPRSPGI
jgi:hypothetical protein